MGLVEIRHGDGIFITRPPEAVLPPLARALADEHEALPAIERGEDGAGADSRFHDGIVAAAGNSLLADLWEPMSAPVDKTRRASLARPGCPMRSLRAHHHILEAIAGGDADEAARAMLEHLAVVADVGFLTTLQVA